MSRSAWLILRVTFGMNSEMNRVNTIFELSELLIFKLIMTGQEQPLSVGTRQLCRFGWDISAHLHTDVIINCRPTATPYHDTRKSPTKKAPGGWRTNAAWGRWMLRCDHVFTISSAFIYAWLCVIRFCIIYFVFYFLIPKTWQSLFTSSHQANAKRAAGNIHNSSTASGAGASSTSTTLDQEDIEVVARFAKKTKSNCWNFFLATAERNESGQGMC